MLSNDDPDPRTCGSRSACISVPCCTTATAISTRCADPTDLTINVYGHFMPDGNRAPVDRLYDALPEKVADRQALRSLFKEPALVMADPGAAFQGRALIFITPGAPPRRLIVAGCGPDCIVQ